MTTPLLTLEDTIGLLHSQLGVSWPNPWWPHGVPTYNDCAAFQSWGLFGLNGDQPFHIVVSDLIERSGLEFHAGNQGIRRGDLLGLRWSAQVNYDHIGMALGPPDATGHIQTIDANGGTNKVAVSVRSILNVHNFARPHYPATSTAGGGGIPIDNQQEDPMTSSTRVFQIVDAQGNDVPDWSRIGPDVLPVGTFPGGYEATADHDTAVRWIAQYGQNDTGPIKWPHDPVVAQQKFGAQEYQLHQAALAKLIKDSTAAAAAPVFDYAAMAKAVNDDAAKRLSA